MCYKTSKKCECAPCNCNGSRIKCFPTKEEEKETLKEYKKELEKEIEGVKRKINELK